MTNVFTYARVSTDHQSTDMQVADLRKYCEARHWDIAGEFIDQGYSGSKNSRPELDRMMGLVRKRQASAVIVWRFDRFARSTKHLLDSLEEFRALGVQFISYQENIDTSSPLGQAMFTIVSAIAQLERDLIRERIRAGMEHAKSKGAKFGRKEMKFKFSIDDARKRYQLGTSLRTLAGEYGVTHQTLWRRLKD